MASLKKNDETILIDVGRMLSSYSPWTALQKVATPHWAGTRRMKSAFILTILFSSLAYAFTESSSCCAIKNVNNAPAEASELNGVYTLKEDGAKREDICIDGCVYVKDNEEYCFIAKSPAESADIVCEVGLCC